MKELINADWHRLSDLLGAERSDFRWRSALNPRFGSVVFLRCSQAAHRKGWTRTAKLISFLNFFIFNIEVPVGLNIGPGLVLPHPQGVVMGAGVVGANVTIFQQVTLGAKVLDMDYDLSKRPTIEDGVTISAGAKVLGGVVIGAGAVVGANAVVVGNVPSNATAVGVPAKSRLNSVADHDSAG